MKALIVYESYHHHNTEKVAERMASVLGAEMRKYNEVKAEELEEYDLLGFGSGIYASMHHKDLLELAENLPEMEGKKAFIFSTSGSGSTDQHKELRKRLGRKGLEIVGEFGCRGKLSWGPFRLFLGGLNKGRPDERDLEKAEEFAKGLKRKG